jgi:hypothetical protein
MCNYVGVPVNDFHVKFQECGPNHLSIINLNYRVNKFCTIANSENRP